MVDTFRVAVTLVPKSDRDMWELFRILDEETGKCLREQGVKISSRDPYGGRSVERKSFQRWSISELQDAYQQNHATPSIVDHYIHADQRDIFLVVVEASFTGYGTRLQVEVSGNDRMASDRVIRDLYARLRTSESIRPLELEDITLGTLTVSSQDHLPATYGEALEKALSQVPEGVVQQVERISRSSTATSGDDTKNEIFVVHGHDELARLQVAATIQQLTGLSPIILHEQRSGGKTVIEKLQEAAAKAVCAVVLLTPDDFGGQVGGPTNARARQNVVFEHGYFAALLGRENVIALTKGGVELPSDLSGVVYISMENEGWKLQLATEMRGISGLTVDSNGLR